MSIYCISFRGHYKSFVTTCILITEDKKRNTIQKYSTWHYEQFLLLGYSRLFEKPEKILVLFKLLSLTRYKWSLNNRKSKPITSSPGRSELFTTNTPVHAISFYKASPLLPTLFHSTILLNQFSVISLIYSLVMARLFC